MDTTPLTSPLQLEPVLPKRRRNRMIQSCFHCRTRKLKCDRQKPACSTCAKLNTPCEYISTGTATDIQNVHAISEKIERLEKELALLKNKRNSVVRTTKRTKSYQQEDQIVLGHAISLFSPTSKDPFLNKLVQLYKSNNSTLSKELEQELDDIRNPIGKLDLIKFNLKKNGEELSDLIKVHIADLNNVWYLVTRFFDSELFSLFYFFEKEEFVTKLSSFSTPRESYDDSDYLFIGQVLIIMRITYLSFYNCGYNEQEVRALKPVDADVYHLAKLCLERAVPTMEGTSIPYLQLLALTVVYQLFATDEIDWVMTDLDKFVKLCYTAELNLDSNSDIHRKVWFICLELDMMRFIYDGTPISIAFDSFTTDSPDDSDNSFRQTVTLMLQERECVYQLVQPISEQLNNVTEPPTIRKYERELENILEYLRTSDLKSIMALPSNTVEQRVVKLHKFNNFLDLSSLGLMLSNHLLVYFFGNDDVDNSAKFSMKVLSCLKGLIPIAYFLNSESNHNFNLGVHFGLSFQLIPKINKLLHRAFQVHIQLLLRLIFLQSHDPKANVQSAINLLISNSEIILSNFGKIGDKFPFADILYKFGSNLISSTVGGTVITDGPIRMKLLESFAADDTELQLDLDFQYILPKDITDNLVQLKGEIKLDSSNGSNLLNAYLQKGLDPFSVHKIESLLYPVQKP